MEQLLEKVRLLHIQNDFKNNGGEDKYFRMAESFSPSQEVNIITGEQRSRVVAANVKGLLYINECGWLRLVPEDAAKQKNFLFFFLQSQRKDVF